jgi:hypothetical protein
MPFTRLLASLLLLWCWALTPPALAGSGRPAGTVVRTGHAARQQGEAEQLRPLALGSFDQTAPLPPTPGLALLAADAQYVRALARPEGVMLAAPRPRAAPSGFRLRQLRPSLSPNAP